MTREQIVHRLFVAITVLMAAVFVPKLLWADTWLYTHLITVEVSLWLASPSKALCLGLGAFYAREVAVALGPDNPGRRPWLLVAVGLALMCVGQLCLAAYQLVLEISTPFPSLADPFFVLGCSLLAVGIFEFARTYVSSGLDLGGTREHIITMLAGAIVLGIVAWILLSPIAAAENAFTDTLLNLLYPLLDFVMLVPVLSLLRITYKLRGGRVWRVWALFLGGVISMAVGDICYAYFTTLSFAALDPLLDLGFAYGYLLVAWSALVQYRLTR